MRVAVTGASGFLGGHICESLLEHGHEPVGLIRRSSDVSLLRGLGIETRHADLTDGASLEKGVAGVDAVIHLAAYYTFFGSWERYMRVNVEGTELLLKAMVDAGIDRLIHCSTTEVIGPVSDPPADEESELRPSYDYGRSKRMAEDVVRSYGSKGIRYTIMRPSGIYGPRNVDDIAYWTITSYANNALGTRFHVGSARNLIQFVHVKDVAQAFMLALERPDMAMGKTYNVSDSRAYSYGEVYDMLSELTGRPAPSLHVPRVVARTLVTPVEAAMRLLGKDSFLYRRSTIDSVTTDRAYSIGRISRDLGYEPSFDLRQGLEDTVAWYREHGHIK